MLVKMGLMPFIHICMDTMRMPRTKAMNSAMPSSSETDWKVRAKQVATMALDSSCVTRVVRDMSESRFLMALMALRRWVMAAGRRDWSSCMRSQAARPSMACMRYSCWGKVPLAGPLRCAQDYTVSKSYLVCQTRHLVGPHGLVRDGVGGIAPGQEVLEEAHVLQAEERDLVVRLVGDLGHGRVLALEPSLDAVAARGLRLLALRRFSVSTVPPMVSTFRPSLAPMSKKSSP